MAIIKIFNGVTYEEVEVSDELAFAYNDMEHREKLNERKETRRHQSLNKSLDNGWDIADETADTEIIAENNELKKNLKEAITKLQPQQKELILKVFYEDMTVTELSVYYGVSKAAICDRLKKIYNKLGKFLK